MRESGQVYVIMELLNTQVAAPGVKSNLRMRIRSKVFTSNTLIDWSSPTDATYRPSKEETREVKGPL